MNRYVAIQFSRSIIICSLQAMSLHLTWGPPDDDGGATVTEFEIDMTSPDNTTRGVYRGRDTECLVASLLPGRPYLFQVHFPDSSVAHFSSTLPYAYFPKSDENFRRV